MIVNLYEETVKVMKENGYTEKDILLVYTEKGIMPTEDFIREARAMNYDNDYGVVYVIRSLTILFENGRMVRDTYDGAECWEYISYNVTIPQGRHYSDLFNSDHAREDINRRLVELSAEGSEPPADAKEVFERFKAGEKLTTEDLITLQKSGYL